MLTARGWWLLIVILALVTIALLSGAATLALIALTLLGWFSGEWLAFLVRLARIQGRLHLERELSDERGPMTTLWARWPASMRLRLRSSAWVSLPFVAVVDALPALARRHAGSHYIDGPLSDDEPLEFSYRIECPAPGVLQFEGVKIQIADLHGFFAHTMFLRERRVYHVLPPLMDASGRLATVKRFNLLPLLGTHVHRRPGSGSDLLDVRDYLPGDPPKMIAWKASARRDRLMTKELESEVPIRCTLFLDVSHAVRLGTPGHTPLARLVEIAAAVHQANAAARDLTGLCLCAEEGVRALVRPARGARQAVRLTRVLSEAAALLPNPEHVPFDELLPLAYGVVQDYYPDLLERDLNAMPAWLPYWVAFWRLGPVLLSSIRLVGRIVRRLSLRPLLQALRRPLVFARTYRWRKQVAAVLALKYGLGPGGLGLLLEDEVVCARYIRRFLHEHQVHCPTPLYDEQGRYLFAAPAKFKVLAEALMASVLRGRDNELFVLLVDVLELGPGLDELLRAVRVALARHHQVVVVCPWPAGVALPGLRSGHAPAPPASGQPPLETMNLQEALARASTARLHQAFAEARHAFARLAVPLVAAPDEEAIALVLRRMQNLRILQRGTP